MAGFQDEDTPSNEELIRAVLYGRLNSGESFLDAQKLLKKSGLFWFRLKYGYFSQVKIEHKIDRIVVMASAVEPVPTSLIKCVRKAAHNITARGGNRGKHRLDAFGQQFYHNRFELFHISKKNSIS